MCNDNWCANIVVNRVGIGDQFRPSASVTQFERSDEKYPTKL